jgi:hypothetical protein
MNFTNVDLMAVNSRISDLRKDAAKARLARQAKLARKR